MQTDIKEEEDHAKFRQDVCGVAFAQGIEPVWTNDQACNDVADHRAEAQRSGRQRCNGTCTQNHNGRLERFNWGHVAWKLRTRLLNASFGENHNKKKAMFRRTWPFFSNKAEFSLESFGNREDEAVVHTVCVSAPEAEVEVQTDRRSNAKAERERRVVVAAIEGVVTY